MSTRHLVEYYIEKHHVVECIYCPEKLKYNENLEKGDDISCWKCGCKMTVIGEKNA